MVAGIMLSFAAALLFATGDVLEKRAVDAMPRLSVRRFAGSVAAVRRSPLWLIGALASGLGSIVQIFAFHLVAITIVQAVSVAGVVAVVFAARLHFRETLHRHEYAGVAISSAALLMTFVSLRGGATSPGEHALAWAVVVSVVGTCAFAAAIIFVLSARESRTDFVFGTSAGLLYGLVALMNKGLSTVLGKGTFAADTKAALSSPYLYLMIATWAAALVLFQLGLQRGRVGIMVPLAGAISAIYVVVVGTPLFGEHLPSDTTDLVLRIAGLAGIVTGSALLSARGE